MISDAWRGSRRAACAASLAAATLALVAPGAGAREQAGAQEKAQEPAPMAPASAATTNRFDGDWTIRVDCPAGGDPSGAKGYTIDFPASVLNGRLFGSRGPQGAVGAMQVEGTIAPDGDALLQARGRTADPELTPGRAAAGTPFSYDVRAHFEAGSASGKRQQQRDCDFTFTRR